MGKGINQRKSVAPDTQHRTLSKGWRALSLVLTTAGILIVVNEMFLLSRFTGLHIVETSYLYVVLAIFLSLVFIFFPATKGTRDRVPWYDTVLFLVNVGVCSFFAWHAETIRLFAYEFSAPTQFTVLAIILWLLVLEGARRTCGTTLCGVVLVFSLYPLFAGYVPGLFTGYNLSFLETVRYHIMSIEGIVGMSTRVVGTMIIGFIMMGMALVVFGGGSFFMNLASAILGSTRGGGAKIAVMASALFGTMSGSVLTNVIATGSVTIPTMKRLGYPATYAAAIETCASTGGILMPPVMGVVAFLMASFLGVPYVQVAVAAAIPSILYFLGLFLQVDAYAARSGLRGLPREELPSLWRTLREGWVYVAAMAMLIWFLLYLKQSVLAPFYSTALLLVLVNVRKETRLSFAKLGEMIALTGRTLAQLAGIMAAVGLIISPLMVTGVTPTLASLLVHVAGGDKLLLLVLGALASLILGTGLDVTACYVLLAIILAPALIAVGLNPMASHLFVLYWGAISFITPPVAVAAYAAASIAQCSPMRTGFQAMRMGGTIYFLPFFFVLNPVLALQGVTLGSLVTALVTVVVGVFLIAGGLQGYIIGIGLVKKGPVGLLTQLLLVAGGIMIAWPTDWTTIVGLLVAGPVVLGYLVVNRRVARTW